MKIILYIVLKYHLNLKLNNHYLKKALKGYNGSIYTIDARKVSMETLGKYFPNTPMLAAIVKVSGIMTDEAFLDDEKPRMKKSSKKKTGQSTLFDSEDQEV